LPALHLFVAFHFMLRNPARRARMASRLASASPCLRMENCFLRTTPRAGLQVAIQLFNLRPLWPMMIARRTPFMPDLPRRRTTSEFQRRRQGGCLATVFFIGEKSGMDFAPVMHPDKKAVRPMRWLVNPADAGRF
jgi:hypothetical protein